MLLLIFLGCALSKQRYRFAFVFVEDVGFYVPSAVLITNKSRNIIGVFCELYGGMKVVKNFFK